MQIIKNSSNQSQAALHQSNQPHPKQPFLKLSPTPREVVNVQARLIEEGELQAISMTTVVQQKDPEQKTVKNTVSPRKEKPEPALTHSDIPLVEQASRGDILHASDETKVISIEEQENIIGHSLSASLCNITLDTKATAADRRDERDPSVPNWQKFMAAPKAHSTASTLEQKHSIGTPSAVYAGTEQLESNIRSHSSEKLNRVTEGVRVSPAVTSHPSYSESKTSGNRSFTPQKLTYSMVVGQAIQNSEVQNLHFNEGSGKMDAISQRKSFCDLSSATSEPVEKSSSDSNTNFTGRVRAASVLEPSLFSTSSNSLWSNDINCDETSKQALLNPMNQFSHWLSENNSQLSGSFSELPTFLSSEFSSIHQTANDYGAIGSEAKGSSNNRASFRSRSKSQSFAFSVSSNATASSNPRPEYDQDSLLYSSIPLFDVHSANALLHTAKSSPEKTSNYSMVNCQSFRLSSTSRLSGNCCNDSEVDSSFSSEKPHSHSSNISSRHNSPCESKAIEIPTSFPTDYAKGMQMHNLDIFRNYPPSPPSTSFAYSYPNHCHFSNAIGQQSGANMFDGNDEAFCQDHSINACSNFSNNRSCHYKQSSPFQLNSYKGKLYLVEFKSGRTEVMFVQEVNSQPEFSIVINDYIIVEADRGEDLGKVVGEISIERMKQIMNDPDSVSLTQSEIYSGIGVKEIVPKRVHRLARPADVRLLQTKAQEEAIAMLRCQSKVRQKKLPMEVVDAEYQWDRNKLTFYFIADRRIDFRELVRDLFRIYKTRIWMCAVDKHRLKLLSSQSSYQMSSMYGTDSIDDSFENSLHSSQNFFEEDFPDDLSSLH